MTPLYYHDVCSKQYYHFIIFSGSSPVRGLLCVLTPRSKMCCLAKLSLLCSAPFWLSRVATRASSSWIVSSSSPSLPADGGPCLNRSSFVDNLNSQDNNKSTIKQNWQYPGCMFLEKPIEIYGNDDVKLSPGIIDLLVCLCTCVVFALVCGCVVWEVCSPPVDGDIGPPAVRVVFWTNVGDLYKDRDTKRPVRHSHLQYLLRCCFSIAHRYWWRMQKIVHSYGNWNVCLRCLFWKGQIKMNGISYKMWIA